MKYVKTPGFIMAAAAWMIVLVADPASGSVLCKEPGSGSTTGTTCPPNEAYSAKTQLHAALKSGSVAEWTTGFRTLKCTGATFGAATSNEGWVGENVGVLIEVTSFEKCGCELFVLTQGEFAVEWIEGTHDGTISWSGLEITARCSTLFGTVHCIYGTNSTHIGTLRGGNPAKLEMSASIPGKPTNGMCAEASSFTGTYEITTPTPLYVAGHTW